MNPELDGQTHARVGDVLNDKWTLERLLGVGGMGAVYAGRHRNGARAAVKVLHRYLSQHPDVRARFLREGYAANRVERPGVVKVLDDDVVVGGPDDGTAYLVMELLDGQSLEDRVAAGWKVSEREFLVVADAVLDVLEAAHAKGVVHRDIKPENLFFAKDESGALRIKVLDFGLARLLEGHSTTTHGLALGTPSFMSPEQAAAKNSEIDGRTDLFALAASGFRLITGRRIHEGTGPIDMIGKMANLPAPRIRTVAPRVGAPFARVIDRALEFRREDRYDSAAAMRLDVQAAIAEIDAAPAGPEIVPVTEPSLELSATDFEHSPVPQTIADPRSKPTLADVPRARSSGLFVQGTTLGIQPTEVLLRAPELGVQPTEPVGHAVPPSAPAASAASAASAAPTAPTEESLSAVPMQRGSLRLVVAGLAAVALLGGIAYATLRPAAPDAPASPEVAPLPEAGVGRDDAGGSETGAPDAAPDVNQVVDAAPAKETPFPKHKASPARGPLKPGKKHVRH